MQRMPTTHSGWAPISTPRTLWGLCCYSASKGGCSVEATKQALLLSSPAGAATNYVRCRGAHWKKRE
eukprot:365759-Chlamydomonas_euryale.AAC.5